MPSPLDQENATSLAVMKIEMQHVKDAMTDMKFQNMRQNEKLDALLKQNHEMDGAKRLLLLLAGAMGTLGGFVGWFISNWKG